MNYDSRYYSQLYFNSIDAVNGDTSRPSFQFQQGSFLNEVKNLRIESVVFPTSYYSVNSSNNYLTLQESIGSAFIVTVDPGNYDAASFATAFKTKLDAASVNGLVYSVAVSTLTGKITISCSGAFMINSQSHLFSFPLSVSAVTHTSTNVIDLCMPSMVYLCSLGLKSRILHPVNMGPLNVHNSILTAVNVTVPPYSQNVWVNLQQDTWYECDLSLNELSFFFQDERGTTIDFNGLPFSLTIGVQFEKAY